MAVGVCHDMHAHDHDHLPNFMLDGAHKLFLKHYQGPISEIVSFGIYSCQALIFIEWNWLLLADS